MTRKKALKRKAAQAVNHLVQAASCLFELREQFLPYHPEYAEFFDFTLTGIGFMIEHLKGVFIKAWGYFPDDVTTWMH